MCWTVCTFTASLCLSLVSSSFPGFLWKWKLICLHLWRHPADPSSYGSCWYLHQILDVFCTNVETRHCGWLWDVLITKENERNGKSYSRPSVNTLSHQCKDGHWVRSTLKLEWYRSVCLHSLRSKPRSQFLMISARQWHWTTVWLVVGINHTKFSQGLKIQTHASKCWPARNHLDCKRRLFSITDANVDFFLTQMWGSTIHGNRETGEIGVHCRNGWKPRFSFRMWQTKPWGQMNGSAGVR